MKSRRAAMVCSILMLSLVVPVAPLLSASPVPCKATRPGDKKADTKKDEPKGALPPHPLDDAFKGNDEAAFMKAIQDSQIYRNAVKAALKAKKEQEDKFKKNPKLRDASPEQAARVKFLKVLSGEND
jgi:hypothetical protein